MIYFKFIFVVFFLFASSTMANDVQIIELHNKKSLDQLVLEKENNVNQQDDQDDEENSVNKTDENSDLENSNIKEDDTNLDKQNDQKASIENEEDSIVYIENETFFDLDNSLISTHLKEIKNIKSKTLHREFINILSNINLEDENNYNDKLYFVITKLYEIGEIEKAYKLVTKINLESANIDKKNLEFFYLIKLNYLYSSYKLSEVCKLKSFLLEQSINLAKHLLQKTDIFCLTLENNFSEAKLLNSLLIESEKEKDENFQKLFNYMILKTKTLSFYTVQCLE